MLCLAFKLVSLNHWKQHQGYVFAKAPVVFSFQISIFESLETAVIPEVSYEGKLCLAFKLVSLNHWKQLILSHKYCILCCV